MTDRPRFYVTTAISYPNGPPHIGHAYEAIATDAIARFKRLDGYDVMFLTGVDEHGLKMAQTAAEEGLAPTEFAARNTALFNRMVDRLDVSADDFIRTTEPRHARASQAIWRRMADAGDIYLGTYSGWYSVRDEAFYAEAETTTNDAGERVSPQGTPVTWTEEQTYFFKLSEYQDRLLKHYTDNPDFIAPPERRNEIVSFVERGLQDLSISRTTFDWGVEVPDADGHVMYVWVDALTNYITGVGYPDEDSPEFQRYWPADLHVIGKDITRFHAVYWPAFLMSAGIDLPKQVFAHGFLFNRGEKMSKSVGNVVDPFAMADRYGVDPMRYFFLREVPFGQDGSYSHEAIVGRINADLANDLGNLAQRSLSMVAKNCDRSIPEPGSFLDADKALLDQVDGLLPQLREPVEARALHTSLSTLWACVAEANRYFAAQEPWALRKSDPQRMATVLYVTAETLRQIAVLAQAVMPTAMASLLNLLGVAQDARSFDVLGPAGRLRPGTKIEPPKPVFPRYIEEDADER